MKDGGISRQQGNWTQLRTLVLRLLEAHEHAVEGHERSLGELKTTDAELKKDLTRCLEEIFGNASTDSLRTAIRLVQAEQAGMRKDVEEVNAKANAAHAKANENSKTITSIKTACEWCEGGKAPKKEGPSTKLVVGLIGLATILANAVVELIKHIGNSGG